MSVVISGASGQLARGVIEALLETVDPAELILVTRTPDKVDVPGAQVRHGDWEQPETLKTAFAGGEKLLLISGHKVGDRVPGHKAAIDAAVAAGVRHIAYTSIVNPSDSNPIAVAAEHRATEEHLRASGAAWTMLRNSIYADLQVNAMQAALATGRHVTNAGDGRTSYVAREDCARAAAAVLASDGHDGREYDITGPEARSPQELVQLFSEVGGKPVELVLVDDEAYARGLVENAGFPEPVARVYATFGTGARLGYSAPVSTTFKELTEREPRTLRSVLEAAA
ncbi:MAG TPA: NAD(P)H-binding protein [Solirubrobacter sp.]|nr:NAD(P)H-binding protein [Solirubrobacter sp.]